MREEGYTGGKVLALHTPIPGSISGTTSVSPNTARSKPGVEGKQKKINKPQYFKRNLLRIKIF